MDFTESELLELLTAVADQKTYYRLAVERGASNGHSKTYFKGKLATNCELYNRLHAMLASIELAEKL